jgi:CubicO group peptidase (beta-lactamase class C family)
MRLLVRVAVAVVALAAGARDGPRSGAQAADAPRPPPRDVSDVLRGPRTAHGVPGMAAAVVRGGALAAQGADGVRRRGDDARVTVGDRWHLGSCTKAMTATLCALLAEDGTLPLETTMARAFPDVAPRMEAGWATARLEWLLQNRGGAPADLDEGGLWRRLTAHRGTPVEMRRDLLLGVVARPPAYPPGSRFLYSNAGYAIAGVMAETRAGRPWEDLLEGRLFGPLGITTAGFGAPGRRGATEQPWGHAADGTPVEPGPSADNPAAIGPAGTVHMSVADWAKFVGLHLDAAAGRPRLLPARAFARLQEPPEGTDYAMGWRVLERDWAGGRVLTHAGSNTMWYCVVWIAPRRDLAVLVCANRGGAEAAQAVDEVAAALVRSETAPPR